jgi:hypothetical protein
MLEKRRERHDLIRRLWAKEFKEIRTIRKLRLSVLCHCRIPYNGCGKATMTSLRAFFSGQERSPL